jgi:hypothetical protein
MIIVPAGDGIDVLEALDFKRFSLRLEAGATQADNSAVSFDGDTAWIAEAALRGWPRGRTLPGWQEGLSAMIAFARTKGWVRPGDGAVRAHVERKG